MSFTKENVVVGETIINLEVQIVEHSNPGEFFVQYNLFTSAGSLKA